MSDPITTCAICGKRIAQHGPSHKTTFPVVDGVQVKVSVHTDCVEREREKGKDDERTANG